jgi:predicted RNase H-like HicB family nuclease
MSVKIRNLQTKVIKEKDGTYAIACSALGVYSVGKTLKETKKSFEEALDLHLSVLRERAVKEIEAAAV